MFVAKFFAAAVAGLNLLVAARTIPFEFQELRSRQNTQYQGYGFVYFTGEDLPNGEQIYFAVSQGNDPLHWNVINNGYAVLNATLGTKGVRDPFIIRSPQNDKFYLIATDLRFAAVNSWDVAGRKGSRSLAIWESPDLKAWSAQRLVEVSPPTAGMSWAPEAVYDAKAGHFIVFWASNLFAASDTNHTGTSYSRIMYANTTDFKTFTPAQVYIDTGSAVIDTSAIYDQATSTWHRFSKAVGNIVQEKSSSFFGKWTTVTTGIGNAEIGQSEGPTCFLSNRYAGVYHLFIDDLSPRGYVPFETGNITSGVWKKSTNYALPTNPRHGTVFGITTKEMQNLSGL
ncbi:glycosyl hydrolase 43 family, partial [Rhizoctonia solani]